MAGSTFLAACRRQPVTVTPVWFMRQAGRSLPEYRALREGVAMMDACRRPDMITEITLQPVRRLGVDAAVLFSDIVVPLLAAGVDVDIVAGVGPVIAEPFRRDSDLDRLRVPGPDDLDFLSTAVAQTVGALGSTPLIGFAGAPFTLASYLVEGGPSKDLARTKALMYGDPAGWDRLLRRLGEISAAFLRVQIEAGADAVQLFDSWVGTVPAEDYRTRIAPHSARVLAAVADVPRIHFGVGTGELLADMAAAGADVVGVDWRVPLDTAAGRVGPGYALQGNLDPALVLAPWPVLERAALAVLEAGKAADGHVFNLGHGVLPASDPGVLARLVELVHASSGA